MGLFETLRSAANAMSFRPSVSTNTTIDPAASLTSQAESLTAPMPTPAPAQQSTPTPPGDWQPSRSPSVSGSMSMTGTNGLKPTEGATGPASPANFPKFSAATQEILKRIAGANKAHTGTPGYEAARESVMKNMVMSDKINTTPHATPPARKRAGARGGKAVTAGSPLVNGINVNGTTTPTGPAALTPTSSRGRGRGSGKGRGRGGGRGGKRKREDSAEETDGDSDASEAYTPVQTHTKSGRHITKPAQFTPALPSPSTGTKRKRVYNKKPEIVVCKVCSRQTSSPGNLIVFCDGCNSPYHQYCHNPPIEKDVVQIEGKEWHCSKCLKTKAASLAPASTAIVFPVTPATASTVPALDLTPNERRQYFSNLSQAALVDLLCHATTLHPSLPVFVPNPRSTLASQPQLPNSLSPSTGNILTNGSATTATLKPSSTTISSSSLSSPPTSNASVAPSLPAPTSAPTSTAAAPDLSKGAESEEEPQPYDDDYDMGHFPKPGNGLARTLRPESEDLQWLVDDNFEVFSHAYGGDGGL